MLDQSLLQQSEIRMGKLTVSITDLGLQCKNSTDPIPPGLLQYIVQSQRAVPAVPSDETANAESSRPESSHEDVNSEDKNRGASTPDAATCPQRRMTTLSFAAERSCLFRTCKMHVTTPSISPS
jgi:hypothetical protein